MKIQKSKLKIANSMTGYTVIELLVALFLFGIVITGAMGSAVSAIKAQRDSSGMQDIEDNSRSIFEAIIREVRTGYDFSIQSSGRRLVFTSVGTSATAEEEVTYELSNDSITRNGLAISNNDVIVEDFNFSGNFSGTVPANIHPIITVFIKIKSDNRPNLNSVSLQMTTSSRYYAN